MEERLLNNEKLYVELPEFTGRNVKISEIAKATGKDPNYIRFGLQQGILKFGTAFKFESSTITARIKKSGRKQAISEKCQQTDVQMT